MTDHPDTDLTDPHGEAEALRKENARLRAELEAVVAERDEARAQVPALLHGYFRCEGCGSTTRNPDRQLERIRSLGGVSCCPERKMTPLTPADATAALDRRDAAMRNEGRRQAALLIVSHEKGTQMHSPPQLLSDAHARILASLEPEGGE